MKVALFSHIADCDGLTPVILSKLTFEKVDYFLAEISDIDEVFLKELSHLDEYDFIFMTDICVDEEVIQQIPQTILDKMLVFDHHISRQHLNKYPFITVIVEDDKKIMQSGTTLYYEYLLKQYPNPNLLKQATKKMVSLVRSLDTWQWDNDKEEALKLGSCLNILGREEYIDYFYKYILTHDTFAFEEKLDYVLELEEKRAKAYIQERKKQIISMEIHPYRIGCVFAENHRSILGNTLANEFADIYDFIVIVNISRSISYRGIKDIDLSVFASRYGGQGHKLAAGSPLPNHLREDVLSMIFKDAKIEEKHD